MQLSIAYSVNTFANGRLIVLLFTGSKVALSDGRRILSAPGKWNLTLQIFFIKIIQLHIYDVYWYLRYVSVVQLFRILESYSANYLSITDAFEGDCGLSVAKGKFYSGLFWPNYPKIATKKFPRFLSWPLRRGQTKNFIKPIMLTDRGTYPQLPTQPKKNCSGSN